MTDVGVESTDPSEEPTSRRRLLRLGAAAAAGAAAGAGLLPETAGASGTPIYIDQANTGSAVTSLTGSIFQAPLEDLGGQVANVRAYGAVGNGTTDDTAAIAAAQSAAGAGCVYFPPGTYLTQSGLSIATNGQMFKIAAGAAILGGVGITGPVISVTAPNVTIEGPGIVDGNTGNAPGSNGLDCIHFSSPADDGLLLGLVVQNASWIGIESTNVNRTRVALCRVLNCARGGISSMATNAPLTGPILSGNVVLLNGASVNAGINVQGNNATNVVNYATVVDNMLDIASGIGYQIVNCQFSRVANNRGRSPGQVISCTGGTDNAISGNSVQAIGNGAGIELGANYSICTGNTISVAASGTSAGIHADNGAGTEVVIANNKITGAYNAGIGIGSYDHTVVTGNVIVQDTDANPNHACIEVAPSGPGMVVIADNICDGSDSSPFAIWLQNLISAAAQVVIHDNAMTGMTAAALHFSGAGQFTDVFVHDNTISSTINLYSITPGLSFGSNVLFHDNVIVGYVPDPGVASIVLPPSGTAYVNTGPYSEVVYLQGGKLSGTGTTQGVVKAGNNGAPSRVLVPASIVLKTPVVVFLDPGESLTVYYTIAPNASKDVRA